MSWMKNTWWLSTLATLVIGVIIYLKWIFNYWKRRNLPYAKPVIPFGTLTNYLLHKEGFGSEIKIHYDNAKVAGYKHYGIFIFWKPIYMPLDPTVIKQILTKDFNYFTNRGLYYNKTDDPLSAHLFSIDGLEWRNLRVKLTPTFTSGKMKTMFNIVVECGNQLKNFVDQKVRSSEPLDIRDTLGCFTTDVIGSCAFGLNCNSFENPNSVFRKYGKRIFEGDMMKSIKDLLCFCSCDVARRLKLRYTHKDVEKFFLSIVKETIEYREVSNIVRNDFLQLLLNLKNETLEDGTKSGLTVEEIAAEAFVFFLAGYDTSSSAMTYCLYELSLDQNIQDKLREEINHVLGKYEEITYESLAEMKYMGQVIEETLRKHPPVPVINRQCVVDYKVPGTDIVIEKDTPVFISNYGLHNDPEYFPNPEKFDPDRFSERNKSKIIPFTYLPFGEGPRNCIGIRFGLNQTKVGLAVLLKNFRFSLNEKTKNPWKVDPSSFVLCPLDKIWLNASKMELD